MVRTGAESLSCLLTIGGCTSGGRSRTTVATRSRTSCAATSMSRSRLKVAMTNETPEPDTERSSLIPSTVFTTSSIRCESTVSTSSGDAPGRLVRTVTVGRSTDGKRSTPSWPNAAAPTTTRARMIITAKTGRRMQTSASFCTGR